MAHETLRATLTLLRKILLLEVRQGYQNRSTLGGGIYAFFHAQFDQHAYDEVSAATAESVLAYLQRYEHAATHTDREALVQVMLRKLDATEARYTAAIAQPEPAQYRSTATGKEKNTASTFVTSTSETLQSEARVSDGGPAYGSKEDFDTQHRVQDTEEESASPIQTTLTTDAVEALGIRKQEQGRLAQLGMTTLQSVVEYWPRDHYDYSQPLRINRLRPDMQVTLIGTLRSVDIRRIAQRNLQIVEAKVADPTGMITVSWFNQPYLLKTLKPRIGEEIAISGAVELRNGALQLTPHEVEFPADEESGIHTGRIIPIYPSSEGIAQRWIRKIVHRALTLGAPFIKDPLPEEIRTRFSIMDRRRAIQEYHLPQSIDLRDQARSRLALDELLLIQLGMLQKKRQWQLESDGVSITSDHGLLDAFLSGLPFTLTGAQNRALQEIVKDMRQSTPMSRLLQGDVGSGKTVVAAAALLLCAKAGMQGALMAPTEILAEQHARTLQTLLEPHGIRVALLTGRIPKAQRARLYLETLQGTIQVLVGTQALIQDGLTFGKLGLAIVDEQHRFGVVQRTALKGKGYNPHLLVMTATPIPRTLTLTMYGDLDVSIINELPPNRQTISTRWFTLDRQGYRIVHEQVKQGHQAYIICPLVEESETLEVRAATSEYTRLQADMFPDLRLGLLHGKMKPQEKEEVLGRFRDGEIQVLVATSVVEVGIDVPNATVMVIQDAQRFGLAQLHQFRGRVGRGSAQSYCVLLADANNPTAGKRLQALCDTSDGFKLAEEDLKLRGPGEFWGTRQSGLPGLQVARVTDMATLECARNVADAILQDDPLLELPQHALLAAHMRQFWDRAAEPN